MVWRSKRTLQITESNALFLEGPMILHHVFSDPKIHYRIHPHSHIVQKPWGVREAAEVVGRWPASIPGRSQDMCLLDGCSHSMTWICLGCLIKLKKCSPKWWFNGDLPWYKVKTSPWTNPRWLGCADRHSSQSLFKTLKFLVDVLIDTWNWSSKFKSPLIKNPYG